MALKPGDRLLYEIEDGQVRLSRADDFSDEELKPIIEAALADAEDDEGIPLDEVVAMLHARIEELSRSSDAA